MSKKKPHEERLPDLLGPEYSKIEEKVREMMEPEPERVSVRIKSDSDPSSAPVLSDAPTKKPLTITIKHHDDTDIPAAIEQAANQALENKKKKLKITVNEDEQAEIADKTPANDDDSTAEGSIQEASEADATEKATPEEVEATDSDEIDDVEPSDSDGEDEPDDAPADEEIDTDDEIESQDDETDEAQDDDTDVDLDEVTPEKTPAESETDEVTDSAPPLPTEKAVEQTPKPKRVVSTEGIRKVTPQEAVQKPVIAPVKLDEPATNRAVDDIIKHESDRLLEADDKEIIRSSVVPKPSFGARLKSLPKMWWRNPIARWLTIVALLSGIGAAGAAPVSRYYLLNAAGVRSSTSLSVIDESTQQPLKDVTVEVAGQRGTTDKDGTVRLDKLRLGRTDLKISKRAYAAVSQPITLGWGSNPLGEFKLKPVGIQYTFQISDYVSGKPLGKAQVVSGYANTQSADDGKAVLTMEKSDENQLTVTVTADGYREEKLTINADTKSAVKMQLVPARKHVFVSKRSGKYDAYKIDADGKNETLVLAGTGSERDDMTLVPHPTDEVAALVSTRDNKRNKDGFLLSSLLLINLSDGKTKSLAESERIQVVGWHDDRLVYVRVAAGVSAGNPQRHRLVSYDINQELTTELASSNYFNDTVLIRNKLLYAPSNAYAGGTAAKLYVSAPDGSNKQTLLNDETWNIFRTDYDTLAFSQGQKWFTMKLSDANPTTLKDPPANPVNRLYIDSPDAKNSLWVDNRDGKGSLINYDTSAKKDTVLTSKSGLKYPIRWLNNTSFVYRINTESETADYIFSIFGGEPKKLMDVSNISSIDSWYYY